MPTPITHLCFACLLYNILWWSEIRSKFDLIIDEWHWCIKSYLSVELLHSGYKSVLTYKWRPTNYSPSDYLLCVYLQCGHLQCWNGITYEQTFQEETTTSEKWLLVVGAPARLPGSGSPCTDCRWRFISWRVLHSMEFGALYNNNIVQDTVGVIWYLGVPSRVTSLCVNRLKIIKISISWESCLWYAVLHVAFIRFEVIADIYYSYFIEFTQQTCRKKSAWQRA